MKVAKIIILVALMLSCVAVSVFASTDSVKSHLDDILKQAQTTYDSHPLHNDLKKCNADTETLRQTLTNKKNECDALAARLKTEEDKLIALKNELAALKQQLQTAQQQEQERIQNELAFINSALQSLAVLEQESLALLAENPSDTNAQEQLNYVRELIAFYTAQKEALLASIETDAIKRLKELIALKEKEITDQENLIAQLKAQLADCQKVIPDIEKDITEQEEKCKKIKEALDELLAKLNKQKELVDKIRALVNKVQTTHGGGENANKDTWPQVKLEVEHILQGVLKEKETSDAAHATKRAEIEAKCKADEQALKDKIAKGEKDLADMKGRLSNLESLIPKLEKAINELKTLIARLEGELGEVEKKCNVLENGTKPRPEDVKELEAIQKVINFTEELHKKKRISDSSRNNLVTKFTDLKNKLEAEIKSHIDKGVAAYKQCLKERDAKKDELTKARVDLQSKEAELKNVREQIEALKKQIDDLEGRLKLYRDQLRHLLDQCAHLLKAHDDSKKSFEQLIADIRAIIAAVDKIIKTGSL